MGCYQSYKTDLKLDNKSNITSIEKRLYPNYPDLFINPNTNTKVTVYVSEKTQQRVVQKSMTVDKSFSNIAAQKLNELKASRITKIKSPSIIEIIGSNQQVKNNQITTNIIMEKGISLQKMIEKKNLTNNRLFSTIQLVKMIYNLFNGYIFFKENNIAHRDIKPENLILFNEDDESSIQLKLSDFGTLINFGENLDLEDIVKHSTQVQSSSIGTMPFMSPELYSHYRSQTQMRFGSKQEMLDFYWKNDVYAMGLTILLMVSLKQNPEPYWNYKNDKNYSKRFDDIDQLCSQSSSVQQINSIIKNLNLTGFSSIEDMLRKMLEDDPNQRITIDLLYTNFNQVNKYYHKEEKQLAQKNYEQIEIIGLTKFNEFIKANNQQKINEAMNVKLDFKAAFPENKLKELEIQVLSSNLERLSNLEMLEFNLEYQEINDKGYEFICNGIGKLKKLQNLTLNLGQCSDNTVEISEQSYCNLENTLSELSNLQQLDLNLTWNKVGENGARHISNALSSFKKLIQLKLNLSYNIIGENGSNHIANGLQQLKQLKYLDLNLGGTYKQNTNIGDNGIKSLRATISKLTSLYELRLNLCFNNITSEGIKSFWEDAKNLKNLKKFALDLKGNNIDSCGLDEIVKTLREFRQLEELELNIHNRSSCNAKVVLISLEVKKFENLRVLKFDFGGYDSKIQDEQIKIICTTLSDMDQLKEISLGLKGLKISAQGAIQIGEMFSKQTSLEIISLDLGGNKEINSEGIKNILSKIENKEKVKQLSFDFSDCDMYDSETKELGSQLVNFTQLLFLKLNLQQNKLSGTGVSSITSKFEKLSLIQKLELDLCDNNIEAQGGSNLASGLCKLNELKELWLNLKKTNIGQEEAKHIVEIIIKVKYLKKLYLNLGYNNLLDIQKQIVDDLKKQLPFVEIVIQFW